MLPFAVSGQAGLYDQSGMGGDAADVGPDLVLDWAPPASDRTRLIWRTTGFAGGANRPRCGREMIEPADHEAAVITGFRLGYDAIAADRADFTRLVRTFARTETRVIIRPTRIFMRLLDESARPELLRDAGDHRDALDRALRASATDPLTRRLCPGELSDLCAGDVPLVTGRPDSRDLWTSAGRRLAGALARTPMSEAVEAIAAMDDAHRRDQEWIISASLATRRPAAGHRAAQPMAGAVTPGSASPARLLAAACAVADEILACGRSGGDRSGRRRVNWLGVQLVDDLRWLLLPMGASLADGYLGVALFLAQLAAITGASQYAEAARLAVRPLPALLAKLADRPDLLIAIGCGGMRGLGGIGYGLARMGTLLADAELRELALTPLRLGGSVADQLGQHGWADGAAAGSPPCWRCGRS